MHTFPAFDPDQTKWVGSTCAHCPGTVALLKKLPNIRTALFSRLGPGTKVSSLSHFLMLFYQVLNKYFLKLLATLGTNSNCDVLCNFVVTHQPNFLIIIWCFILTLALLSHWLGRFSQLCFEMSLMFRYSSWWHLWSLSRWTGQFGIHVVVFVVYMCFCVFDFKLIFLFFGVYFVPKVWKDIFIVVVLLFCCFYRSPIDSISQTKSDNSIWRQQTTQSIQQL